MKLDIIQNGTRRRVGTLPKGDDGISATVAAMQALVDHAISTGRERLTEIVDHLQAAGNGPGSEGFAIALYYWLERSVSFERDPDGIELVRSPLDMLDELDRDGVAFGDCDDLATLAAAIIAAAGYPPVLVTVGTRKPGRFEHVFAGIRTSSKLERSGVVPIDPQEHTGPATWPRVPRVRLWSLSPTLTT